MLQLIERQRDGEGARRGRWRLRLRRPSGRALLRGLGMAAVVLLLAVGGILIGLRGSGRTTRTTAIGTLSLSISPAIHGQVDAFIPIADWVCARTRSGRR